MKRAIIIEDKIRWTTFVYIYVYYMYVYMNVFDMQRCHIGERIEQVNPETYCTTPHC